MKKEKSFAIILLILAFNAVMTISIDTAKAATLDTYEPDNDHKEACVLRNDEPQQHSIYPVGDYDWLELRIDCESDVTIETSGPSGNTELWLYRQDLTQIAYDDDSGHNLFSKISTHLTPAIYYIKVGDYLNNSEISEYHIKAMYTRVFQSICGGSNFDEGNSVRQTSDGGYIIAGYTTSYGSGGADVYLVKTDSNGNNQWQKTFGGANNDFGSSVQQTSDGGYIIAGYTTSYGSGGADVYLVKTDSNGNMQWHKTYGSTYDDAGNSVRQTLDGGYAIAGYKETSDYCSLTYIVKTDSSGNMQWEKTYGTDWNVGSSVQQTSDSGYIIAGYTRPGLYHDACLIKTDSSGNFQWQKTYGSGYDEKFFSVQQVSGGGYIAVGYTGDYYSDVYLVKTDSSGNIQWQRTYGITDNDLGLSLQQTSDSGFIIAGSARYGSGSADAYLVKTDSSGNLQWQETYGSDYYDVGRSVQQTSNGGYVIAGGLDLIGVGAEKADLYLISTDQNGYSPSYRDNIVEEGTSLIPQVVYNVIHDPCGDGSFSYLEQTKTQSVEAALSVGASSSVGVKAEAKFLGTGVQAAGEVTMTTSTTLSEAFIASYSAGYGSNTITNDAQYIGPGYGDAYFGEAWVFHYRIVDRIFMNGTTKRLMEYGPTRESRFLVSTTWIRNNIAEPWRSKLFALNPAHDNYISPEEQQKAMHLASIIVTGGNPWSQSYEVTSRKKTTLDFSVRISEYVALECGFEIVPGTKVGATVEVKLSFNLGITLETSIEQNTRIGFEVYDDDGPDSLSIDVWYDQVFGTYMFTTNPSETVTSNPREYSDNFAPDKPGIPDGYSLGYVGYSYVYTAVTGDDDGDNICYQFDWGDDSTSTSDWKASNEAWSASNTWVSTGLRYVKVRAKDSPLEVWGDWSDPKAVLVTIPGDVNGDRVVDIFDMAMIAGAYGTSRGQPGYIASCDINDDGIIDIFDVVIAAGHYGESW